MTKRQTMTTKNTAQTEYDKKKQAGQKAKQRETIRQKNEQILEKWNKAREEEPDGMYATGTPVLFGYYTDSDEEADNYEDMMQRRHQDVMDNIMTYGKNSGGFSTYHYY